MLCRLAFSMLLASAVTLSSCGGNEDNKPDSTTDPKAAATSLPESYWLAEAPDAALDINKAKEVAQTGKEITVVGRVGELNEKRAMFHLIDKSFVPCSEKNPPTGCPTPWDYCCDEKHVLNKGTVIVEFHDGNTLRNVTAKGFHGLDHLKEIVVKGTARIDSAGNFTVVASGMHVRN